MCAQTKREKEKERRERERERERERPVTQQAAFSVYIVMGQFIFQKVSFIVPF